MVLTTMAAAMGQGQQDMIVAVNGQRLLIFIGIASFALLGQAMVMVGMAIGALRAKKDVEAQITDLKAKVMPLVDRTHLLITEISAVTSDLAPKIRDISAKVESISGHAEEISAMLKDKVVEFGPTITAANETLQQANQTVRVANIKTQQQVLRVNDMVSGVLDATTQMGKSIQRGINVPVNEVSRILDGVKVGLTTFLNGKPKSKMPMYRPPVGTYKPEDEA